MQTNVVLDRHLAECSVECASSVYGPVSSWRLGWSLGIDLLLVDSICSFDCVYCQLGRIHVLTSERRTFVPTEKLMADLAASDWKKADVVTYSGSGEPTLALNLGESIDKIREFTGLPIVVLTNSTLLNDPQVRRELSLADRIECKLDAWSSDGLRRINRPVANVDVEGLINGIATLRSEFAGTLAVQTMVLSAPDQADIERFSKVLRQIKPDEVHLNVPLRPVPGSWEIENRGNRYTGDEHSHKLKTIRPADLHKFADAIERSTNLRVITPSMA